MAGMQAKSLRISNYLGHGHEGGQKFSLDFLYSIYTTPAYSGQITSSQPLPPLPLLFLLPPLPLPFLVVLYEGLSVCLSIRPSDGGPHFR